MINKELMMIGEDIIMAHKSATVEDTPSVVKK
jgi:hypothetical protein